MQVVDWLKEMVGFPASASGTLTSGGSMANMVGLTVARNTLAGVDVRQEGVTALPQPLCFYTSDQAHSCHQKALETLVLACADELASASFRSVFPAAGLDFKVMGHRVGTSVTLTVALALIDRHVRSVADYFAIKDAVRVHIASTLSAGIDVRINTLDDPAARDESGVYVTVSGTSAEMGDDGEVGRGNRASRLITPSRPMSLEACAGKNPVAHVGKIYNVLAMRIAEEVHAAVSGAPAVDVALLSAIGAPIDQPQVASIEVGPRHLLTADAADRVRGVCDERLRRVEEITELVLFRRVSLF